VVLPDGKDPDEFISSGGDISATVAQAKNYVESLADSLVGNLDTPKARLDAATTIGFVLSRIDEDVIRDSIAAKVAPKLGVGVAEIRKQIAKAASVDLHGKAESPQPAMHQMGEPLRNLIARLLYIGKEGMDKFNWRLINEPAVTAILESDYEPGNQAAISIVLSGLDPSVESAVVDIPEDVLANLSIRDCYVSLLTLEIQRASERVGAGQADIMELCPLLDEIKKLNEI
jgi:DNA primase